MTIACKLTLNSQVLYPELPIDRTALIQGTVLDLQNGNSRFYHRKTRYAWTMTIADVDETTRGTWETAAATSASVTFIDERSTSYTCRVTDVSTSLSRTTPAVAGGTNTTGPGFYDLSVSIEQIQ